MTVEAFETRLEKAERFRYDRTPVVFKVHELDTLLDYVREEFERIKSQGERARFTPPGLFVMGPPSPSESFLPPPELTPLNQIRAVVSETALYRNTGSAWVRISFS